MSAPSAPSAPTHTYGPGQVEVVILTKATGPLARFGHDLSFRVGRLELSVHAPDGDEPGAQADAVVKTDSLELLSPMSDRDKADIMKRLKADVLKPNRWPEARFETTEPIVRHGEGEHARLTVVGELTLCGVTRPLRLELVRDRKEWGGQAVLHQPDFGIKPYKAALGGLRIAPDVTVQLRAPALG